MTRLFLRDSLGYWMDESVEKKITLGKNGATRTAIAWAADVQRLSVFYFPCLRLL